MRLEKDQIKRSRQDRVGGHEKESKRRRKERSGLRQRRVTCITGKVIEKMTAIIDKSG